MKAHRSLIDTTRPGTSGWQGWRVGITGGTSSLGRVLVNALHAQGAQVAFVARHADAVTATAAALPGSPCIVGDLGRKDDIHAIALQMLGTLGGLDLLVNNASSLGPAPLALLADTECEAFEAALQTNLLGPFRLARAVLGALAASAREGRAGLVLNVGSDAGQTPYPRWGAYGASKAALAHMSRIWDEELRGSGVRVLCMDPGDMDTPLHALALPDADPATFACLPRTPQTASAPEGQQLCLGRPGTQLLKPPATAARELMAALQQALRAPATQEAA